MLIATVQERRSAALERFRRVRAHSAAMCRPLEAEEFRLQPMEDVSPPWWNLGHTSWFFVRNCLVPFGGEVAPEDEQYDYLLNSYYASLGERLPRGRRGSISRPTTAEIFRYRQSVDRRVETLLNSIDEERLEELLRVLEIGLQHEQQHQELFYTEIKFIRAQNVRELRRAYPIHDEEVGNRWRYLTDQDGESPSANDSRSASQWLEFDGGLLEFGYAGTGFCWDNELPVHRQYLAPFAIADRLVTNGQFLEFIEDGGYRSPLLWLDNGWRQVEEQNWQAPLYWEQVDGQWWIWMLAGMRPLALDEPVCHLSFYEADAFARWRSQINDDERGVRLPNEREWEHAARLFDLEDSNESFLDCGRLHPSAETQPSGDWHGVLWQWTASYYEPYPGYRPWPGVLAEYNGKFMDNQRVLRGGSCATPRDHYRPTYRNFWPPATRFQFTGVRLARDL